MLPFATTRKHGRSEKWCSVTNRKEGRHALLHECDSAFRSDRFCDEPLKPGWSHPDCTMESAREMALATKARRQANLRQVRGLIVKQLFCPFDAAFKDILIRCKAQAFLEHSYEMVRAEFCYVRQLANCHCSP